MDQIVSQMQRFMKRFNCGMLFCAGADSVLYLSDMEFTPSSCNPVLYAVQPLSPTVIMVPASGRRVIFTASALKQYIDDRRINADVYYYSSTLFIRYDPDISRPEIYAPSLKDCIKRYLSDFSCTGADVYGDEPFRIFNEKNTILADNILEAEPLLTACRAIKVPEEIRRLRIASRVSYEAMEQIRITLEEGGPIRENDLFYIMRDVIYRQRCQWNYTSLSAGPYSSDIYHRPCNYSLQDGDVVRMDVGAVWEGYGSDVARCYFYGKPKEEEKRLYETLCEAQHRMVEAAGPGCDLGELFHIGDTYIKSHGYPEYRRSGLGHSVGVLTEEQPFISPRNAGVIMEENMIFSIETPYYIKDKAGFNVEDILLITSNGHEILMN